MKYDRALVERLKRTYPEGTVIRLISMQGEDRMTTGLLGKVVHIDDIGQIRCDWDNGSTLALNTKYDTFEIVSLGGNG